jgi:hypothetical protein
VGGKDHEVGGDTCSGGWVEAGDGEDGLHSAFGEREVPKSAVCQKNLHFCKVGMSRAASNV